MQIICPNKVCQTKMEVVLPDAGPGTNIRCPGCQEILFLTPEGKVDFVFVALSTRLGGCHAQKTSGVLDGR